MLTPFLAKLESKQAKVGIIGLGYVGLPLAITFAKKGFKVLGFDIDPKKPEAIHAGPFTPRRWRRWSPSPRRAPPR